MSGSCCANHISLVSGVIGCTGAPVSAGSSAPRSDWRSERAWSRARASAQVMSGVSGRSSESRAISPCIAALTETASTSAPAAAAAAVHSASAAADAARIVAGSCTSWSGVGRSSGYSRIAARRHHEPSPKATALTPVVPTSRPTITSVGACTSKCVPEGLMMGNAVTIAIRDPEGIAIRDPEGLEAAGARSER